MNQSGRVPQIGVGAIVEHGGRILLVLRGKPPNAGQWAIPGGRLHWGETLQQAAEREILEETGIRIRAGEVIYQFEFIERDEDAEVQFHYVILDLAGEYLGGELQHGDDAADARWVDFNELCTLRVNSTTLKALQTCFPDQLARSGA